MKNLKKIMFLTIAVFALVLSSCSSNDDDSNDDDQEETEFIKFKYKDNSYSFEPSYSTSLTTEIMGSEGMDNTYKRVALWMPLNPTKGSHPIVFNLSELETTYQASFTFMPELSNSDATSGTINITVLTNDKIEGTFNFAGTKNGATFTVAEGSFSVQR